MYLLNIIGIKKFMVLSKNSATILDCPLQAGASNLLLFEESYQKKLPIKNLL